MIGVAVTGEGVSRLVDRPAPRALVTEPRGVQVPLGRVPPNAEAVLGDEAAQPADIALGALEHIARQKLFQMG